MATGQIDLCPDYEEYVNEALIVAPDLPVHPVSATERIGLEALGQYLKAGSTAVFLGASGVGKSALVNALSGREAQDIGEVREADGKGRHTTTRRQLVVLPGGGLVIDTPGMRELAMAAGADGLESTFEDVERFFADCRFRDCRHEHEPGCGVRRAIDSGELEPARWGGYLKLLKEEAFQRRRRDLKSRLDEKRRWKAISQWSRQRKKARQWG